MTLFPSLRAKREQRAGLKDFIIYLTVLFLICLLSFMVLKIAFLVVAVNVAVVVLVAVVFVVAVELRHLMKKYNIGWL